jgi:hypothetical protein
MKTKSGIMKLIFIMLCSAFAFANNTLLAQKKVLFMVQVNLYDGSKVKGLLGTLNDSTLQVTGKEKSGLKTYPDSSQLNRTIAFNKIQSIGYRKLNAPQTGALVGLGVGFLVSLAVKPDNENCDPNSLSGPICEINAGIDEIFVEGLIVVGASGLGAIIGSSFKKIEIQGKKDNLILFRNMIVKKERKN